MLAAASGIATLNGSSLVVQNPANAVEAATASKIPIRDANAALLSSVAAAVTAGTTQSQGQGPLTAEINIVTVCANANDVVTLPAAAAGLWCLVANKGAETLQVFPASGDDLGAGVNTSTTIAAAGKKLWAAYDATTWLPVVED
jgi:hypothetical protein